MRKTVSLLTCAALTASLMLCAPFAASAEDAPAVGSDWQYKTLVDFEELSSGFQFGGKDDVGYTLYLNNANGYGAKVGDGGYNGSNTFNVYAAGTKSVYAQPLINVAGFQEKNTEFEGATEFWMWVDFSNITFDKVSMQFRIIEGDYNTDGTPIADQLSQWAPAKGKPIYIQSSPTSWKTITIGSEDADEYKLPLADMVGYKGFIRIPISSFCAHEAGYEVNGKFDLLNVTQVWMIFNFPNNNADEYYAVDQLMFVGPSLNEGKAISKISLKDTNQSAGGSETQAPAATTAKATEAAAATTTTAAETTVLTTTSTSRATTTTAAPVETTEAVEANTSSGSLTWLWVVLGVVVVAGAGAAVYFFVIRKKKA